jgi:hypothetical protein
MDSNLLNKKYSVLVAGNVDLSDYDLTKQVSPYVVYEYSKRKEIRQQAISIYKELLEKLENDPVNTLVCQVMRLKIQDMIEMSDEEYFEIATQGMIYDTTTGDALSTINPKGRYLTLMDPTSAHAVPLYNNKFNCLVKDIKIKDTPDKDLIEKYSAQWDYFMESAPMTKNDYIKLYGNKETYIAAMMEPFFYNAFVSNETGWVEQGDENQVQWIIKFRERFINNLPINTPLRVYNFTK